MDHTRPRVVREALLRLQIQCFYVMPLGPDLWERILFAVFLVLIALVIAYTQTIGAFRHCALLLDILTCCLVPAIGFAGYSFSFRILSWWVSGFDRESVWSGSRQHGEGVLYISPPLNGRFPPSDLTSFPRDSLLGLLSTVAPRH